MKKLFIKIKAKRYDEAIERAKSLVDFCSDSELKTLEYVFPELKESEDERIRKALCKAIWTYVPTEEGQEYIAWLEKQGEQKPAWSEEDDEMLKMVIKSCEQCGNEYAYYWLKSLKERVQPKQEWSGGDEAHLHSLVTHLEQWIESNPDTTGADIQGENVAWLKSIRPQNRWISIDKEVYVREPILAQKKDKSDPFGGFVVCCDHTLTPNVYERYMILGNIVYQNTWKPSDEQLNNILDVLSFDNCTPKRRELLESLYQDLKKLSEE